MSASILGIIGSLCTQRETDERAIGVFAIVLSVVLVLCNGIHFFYLTWIYGCI